MKQISLGPFVSEWWVPVPLTSGVCAKTGGVTTDGVIPVSPSSVGSQRRSRFEIDIDESRGGVGSCPKPKLCVFLSSV